MLLKRKYSIGAEFIPGKGVYFRIWSQKNILGVYVDGQIYPMEKEKKNYYSAHIKAASENSRYGFKIENEDHLISDPASHFQPEGPKGLSAIVNHSFRWTDQNWLGILSLKNQIIYELHIGTFTEEGNFSATQKKLKYLSKLGITIIEIMPINEFYGKFGWGYDGVNLFAPYHLYGTPKDLKKLINEAHRLNLGVILDVVYNHFGPEVNNIKKFSEDYFHKNLKTDWGDAINFDTAQTKEFFLTNARYWIEEYHFDGLRVDSTSSFLSKSTNGFLSALASIVKKSGGKRKTIIIGENEPQNSQMLKPIVKGGNGFDALWNDDFHHSARVRLTGKREAYFMDYLGNPQEFISLIKYGFLYQGQQYRWHGRPRGTPDFTIAPEGLVIFLENHDQISNSNNCYRIHQLSEPALYRVLTCILLLSPNTPLLFQGQEFGSKNPFYYFADHTQSIGKQVKSGRREFLAQFPSIAAQENISQPDPTSEEKAFIKSKLNFNESNIYIYNLHKELIQLKKKDHILSGKKRTKIDGAVLGDQAFLIRIFGQDNDDRLLIVNFGVDLELSPIPEPLICQVKGRPWKILWSSEFIQYGGRGMVDIDYYLKTITGHTAVVLTPT